MSPAKGEIVAFAIMQSKFGKADDLLEALSGNLYRTLQMDGVKEAYVSQALDEQNRFFTYSRWESLEAYDRMQQDLSGGGEEGIVEMLESAPVWGAYMIIDT